MGKKEDTIGITEEPLLSQWDTPPLEIDKDILKRFKNITVPSITHMDTLESALVVSAELGNQKNAEYLQSLIGVEKSLQDNPIFKEANKLALQIKDTFTSYNESPAMKELMEIQKKAQDTFLNVNKPIIDSMESVRQNALKLTMPQVKPLETHLKVNKILFEGIQEAKQRSSYHKNKSEELAIHIEQLEEEQKKWDDTTDTQLKINTEVTLGQQKTQMEYHFNEGVRLASLVQIEEPMYVSQYMKDTHRQNMKPFEIPTSKKAGKTYLTKAQKNLLEDLRPYFNRDFEGSSDWDEKRFDTGNRDYHHENQFRNLAHKYGMTVDGIKKFAQKHDPSKK
jgi:hypothetical protein|tara:strand:- start:470 stop:1480 length:1011 start_codon:yes stop_codon:yes gene_type:complete